MVQYHRTRDMSGKKTDRPFSSDTSLGELDPGPFTISGRLQSFTHALRGLLLMLRSQHNAWLHASASILVLFFGAIFRLDAMHWCWLVIAIMSVWTAEALNTALEFLADVASPEFHPLIKKAKDVAAAAVLISAIGSATIGFIILGPYFVELIRLFF